VLTKQSSAVICVQVSQQDVSDLFGLVTASGKPPISPDPPWKIAWRRIFHPVCHPIPHHKYDAAISLITGELSRQDNRIVLIGRG